MNEVMLFDNLNKFTGISSGLVDLCQRCFNIDNRRAKYIMSKFFEHENSHCAVGFINGRIVSFYGVLISSFMRENFAISINTMSDGSMPRSTTLLGEVLYENLLCNYNVKTIIGYPNKYIIDQRIRYLGWEYITDLCYAFVGYPNIYYDWWMRCQSLAGLDINISGTLRKNTLAGVPLYSPRLSNNGCSVLPGLISFDCRHVLPRGSLRIPKLTKKLCVKKLHDSSQLYIKLQEGSVFLSHDSIDVP